MKSAPRSSLMLLLYCWSVSQAAIAPSITGRAVGEGSHGCIMTTTTTTSSSIVVMSCDCCAARKAAYQIPLPRRTMRIDAIIHTTVTRGCGRGQIPVGIKASRVERGHRLLSHHHRYLVGGLVFVIREMWYMYHNHLLLLPPSYVLLSCQIQQSVVVHYSDPTQTSDCL